MDENTLQWVIDHMSNEEYAKYKKDIAEAEKRGAERTVAKLLSEDLISREKAASVLGVDETSLDQILGKYRV